MSQNPPAKWLGDLAPYNHPQVVAGPSQSLPRFSSPSDAAKVDNVFSKESTAVLDQHRYAYVGGSLTAQIKANESVQLIQAQNVLRNLLFFRNASATANFYIDFGNQAGLNSALILQPGQIILFDTVVPQDDVYIYADAVNSILRYFYSTLGVR